MYSFRPDPGPTEREALELALARMLESQVDGPCARISEWRRAALEEGVGMDDEPDSER